MRCARFAALAIAALVAGRSHAHAEPAGANDSTENASDSQEEDERPRILAEAQRAHDQGRHEAALALATRASSIRESSAVWRFIAEQNWLIHRTKAATTAAERCLARIALEPLGENRVAVEQGCRFILEQTASAGPATAANPAPTTEPETDQSERQPGVLASPGRGGAEPPNAGVQATRPWLAVPVAAPEQRWYHDRTWPILAVGVGASALVAAGIVQLAANGRYDELEALCRRESGCPVDKQSVRNRVERLDWLSAGLAAGGVLAGGLGVSAFWVHEPSRPASDRVELRIRSRF